MDGWHVRREAGNHPQTLARNSLPPVDMVDMVAMLGKLREGARACVVQQHGVRGVLTNSVLLTLDNLVVKGWASMAGRRRTAAAPG